MTLGGTWWGHAGLGMGRVWVEVLGKEMVGKGGGGGGCVGGVGAGRGGVGILFEAHWVA